MHLPHQTIRVTILVDGFTKVDKSSGMNNALDKVDVSTNGLWKSFVHALFEPDLNMTSNLMFVMILEVVVVTCHVTLGVVP